MATRKRTHASARASTAQDTGNSIADSAQKIWLAGLGAFERARAEGPKMFDLLVEQGLALGGKARVAADDALRGVLVRMAREYGLPAVVGTGTATRRKARRRS